MAPQENRIKTWNALLSSFKASILRLRTLTKHWRDTAARYTLNQALQDFIRHVITIFCDTLLKLSYIGVLPTVLVHFPFQYGPEVLCRIKIRRTNLPRQKIHSFSLHPVLSANWDVNRTIFLLEWPTFPMFNCCKWQQMLRKTFTKLLEVLPTFQEGNITIVLVREAVLNHHIPTPHFPWCFEKVRSFAWRWCQWCANSSRPSELNFRRRTQLFSIYPTKKWHEMIPNPVLPSFASLSEKMRSLPFDTVALCCLVYNSAPRLHLPRVWVCLELLLHSYQLLSLHLQCALVVCSRFGGSSSLFPASFFRCWV